jgi:hypothetical protein
VTPFEADDSLQRYTPYVRAQLEKLIMSLGNVLLLDRNRVDSRIADPSQAAQFGKIAGASIVVTGSLLTLATENKQSDKTSSSRSVVTMHIRAYDVDKKTLAYSSPVSGAASSARANIAGVGKTDESSAAIEAAIRSLGNDPRFRDSSVRRNKSRSVHPRRRSTRRNADGRSRIAQAPRTSLGSGFQNLGHELFSDATGPALSGPRL